MNSLNIFRNYSLDVDSYSCSSSDQMQFGGNNGNSNEDNDGVDDNLDNQDIPNGGFPPIYLCSKVSKKDISKKEDETLSTKREYKTHKTALSITEILEKRKKGTPIVQI